MLSIFGKNFLLRCTYFVLWESYRFLFFWIMYNVEFFRFLLNKSKKWEFVFPFWSPSSRQPLFLVYQRNKARDGHETGWDRSTKFFPSPAQPAGQCHKTFLGPTGFLKVGKDRRFLSQKSRRCSGTIAHPWEK